MKVSIFLILIINFFNFNLWASNDDKINERLKLFEKRYKATAEKGVFVMESLLNWDDAVIKDFANTINNKDNRIDFPKNLKVDGNKLILGDGKETFTIEFVDMNLGKFKANGLEIVLSNPNDLGEMITKLDEAFNGKTASQEPLLPGLEGIDLRGLFFSKAYAVTAAGPIAGEVFDILGGRVQGIMSKNGETVYRILTGPQAGQYVAKDVIGHALGGAPSTDAKVVAKAAELLKAPVRAAATAGEATGGLWSSLRSGLGAVARSAGSLGSRALSVARVGTGPLGLAATAVGALAYSNLRGWKNLDRQKANYAATEAALKTCESYRNNPKATIVSAQKERQVSELADKEAIRLSQANEAFYAAYAEYDEAAAADKAESTRATKSRLAQAKKKYDAALKAATGKTPNRTGVPAAAKQGDEKAAPEMAAVNKKLRKVQEYECGPSIDLVARSYNTCDMTRKLRACIDRDAVPAILAKNISGQLSKLQAWNGLVYGTDSYDESGADNFNDIEK